VSGEGDKKRSTAAAAEADADARVAGIEAILKDMTCKLEDTQAAADEAAREANEKSLEGQELKKKLEHVVSEKNTIERMLEEMARKKSAAEEAAVSAEVGRYKLNSLDP
jgi:chromosome segregation ATPase